MGSNDHPNFFKAFIPSTCSECLSIPVPFMKHINHEASSLYLLMGPSENTWTVRLIKNADAYFFEEGWPEFVKDNALELGDICVFEYKGNSKFTVEIFDQTEGQKESAFDATCSQGCNLFESDKGQNVEIKEAVKVPSTYESREGVSKRKGKKAANDNQGYIASGTLISRRREVTKEEKLRAIEAAKAFKSSHPFTMIVMRPSYVYTGLSLSHLPEAKREMTLTDANGRAWPVIYCSNTRSHMKRSLSGGWRAFCYDHNITTSKKVMYVSLSS